MLIYANRMGYAQALIALELGEFFFEQHLL